MSEPPLQATLIRLSVAESPVRRFETGSLPVFAVGEELVLKFYPDEDADEARTEATTLGVLGGRLSVPTPVLEEAGVVDGWHFVLMRRLRGADLDTMWPSLSFDQRLDVCEQVGAATAELHAVGDPRLTAPGSADWHDFVRERRGAVVEHHRRQGLAPEWLERIPAFLDSVALTARPPVLLHTELLREHILIRPSGKRWLVSGLLDFEPSMLGAAEYEFVAASVYLAGGEPALWRGFLRGYGHLEHPGEEFSRRCQAYTLLHRYSALRRYLTWMPKPRERSFDELARLWFG